MTCRPSRTDEEPTTPERPSSFRDAILRDRRLVSRRKMDKRLRDRAAERSQANGTDHTTTYFPALSRMLEGGAASEWRAIAVIVVLIIGAFFFGLWLGLQ